MNKQENLLEGLRDFRDTFNNGGKNSDITQHEIRKTINSMTKNQDYSKTKISDRKIED